MLLRLDFYFVFSLTPKLAGMELDRLTIESLRIYRFKVNYS